MKYFIRYSVYFTALFITFSGCSSSYHVTETGGGFSVTKLAQNTYQIHNLSDRHTTQKEVSQYILRRCAQMTLEEGNRYFLISSQSQSYDKSDNSSISYGQAIFKIVTNNTQQNIYPILDAVTVVKKTEDVSEGKLSAKARQAYDSFLDDENN